METILSRRAARHYSAAMEPEAVYAQIRAHIAFEHMLVAVLIASAVCGALKLAIGLAALALHGLSFDGALSAVYGGVAFACISFLVGFFAAVAIGLPLFLALERAKLRKTWPYVVAGFFIESFVAVALAGGTLTFSDLGADGWWLVFLPGVLAAILFGRRMRPVWRAAEKAESAPPLYRIH